MLHGCCCTSEGSRRSGVSAAWAAQRWLRQQNTPLFVELHWLPDPRHCLPNQWQPQAAWWEGQLTRVCCTPMLLLLNLLAMRAAGRRPGPYNSAVQPWLLADMRPVGGSALSGRGNTAETAAWQGMQICWYCYLHSRYKRHSSPAAGTNYSPGQPSSKWSACTSRPQLELHLASGATCRRRWRVSSDRSTSLRNSIRVSQVSRGWLCYS